MCGGSRRLRCRSLRQTVGPLVSMPWPPCSVGHEGVEWEGSSLSIWGWLNHTLWPFGGGQTSPVAKWGGLTTLRDGTTMREVVGYKLNSGGEVADEPRERQQWWRGD